MATVKTIKHVCDRCGASLEAYDKPDTWYPKHWQHMTLGQTGAKLDLCESCNMDLLHFLTSEGAENMNIATHRDTEVI
jgi:hypothetical protein